MVRLIVCLLFIFLLIANVCIFSDPIKSVENIDKDKVFPIHTRIQNRSFPSIFSAWGGIGWSSVLNLPEKTDFEQMVLHDLYFSSLIFHRKFEKTQGEIRLIGDMNEAIEKRDVYLSQNPNMLFIVEIRMREAYASSHPKNSTYWLRDKNGKRIVAWKDGAFFIDFTKPVVIDKIVNEAIAVANCGLYDGIFFDWWSEDGVVLADGKNAPWGAFENSGYRGFIAEQNARDTILKLIREKVPKDFIILVNGNRRKFPRTKWAINGTFMETLRDNIDGYTYEGLKEIEDTLYWAECNLREPRVNCLEGWGIPTEELDSHKNLQWMRVFTTMSLTHSDGYVLYNNGTQHKHYWYKFWDTDLGKPITDKRQVYNDREGLFIREFTGGWAIYNRSREEQSVEFPTNVTGVSSKVIGTRHIIPDLDGEIFKKSLTYPEGDVTK